MKKTRKKINISLHYSFIIFIVLSYFASLFDLVLMYFICLVSHELMHAFVAKKRGYKIGKIKLMATGAVLEAESDEFSSNDEIKIAIAGPLFNLFISICLFSSWWIMPELYNYTLDLCVINLALFCFNMLPVFPLDGGRVLLAILSKKIERKRAIFIVKSISIIFSICLFLLFVFSLFITPNFSFGLMGITIFISVITEDKNACYKRVYYLSRKQERINKQGLEQKYLIVSYKLPREKLLKFLEAKYYTVFICVDENFKTVKIISEADLIYNN